MCLASIEGPPEQVLSNVHMLVSRSLSDFYSNAEVVEIATLKRVRCQIEQFVVM